MTANNACPVVEPGVGELWGYAGRVAIICGNCVDDDGTIWVMDWNSGDRTYAPLSRLEARDDRDSVTSEALVARFGEWARAGNADAMWFLAYWFEGQHHPRSVWYYVASMRVDPKRHAWAQSRVSSDARSAYMCEGVPAPDIRFVEYIPELNGRPIGTDWRAAVQAAEAAVHVPAVGPRPRVKGPLGVPIKHRLAGLEEVSISKESRVAPGDGVKTGQPG